MSRHISQRERQQERWAQYGLIERQQDWQLGRRGSYTDRHPDTEERMRIIRATLADQRVGFRRPTLFDAAGELILQGFDLPKIALARQWLTAVCDDYLVAWSPYLRGKHTPDEEPPSRERVARYVRAGADRVGLSNSGRDVAMTILLAGNGQMPSQERPIGEIQISDVPQEVSLLDFRHTRWLLEPKQTPDGQLNQVLIQARSVPPEATRQVVTALQTLWRLKPDDLVRGLLPPTHRCSFHHTLDQVAIPTLVFLLLKVPNAFDDVSDAGTLLPALISEFKHHPFTSQLGSVLDEIGGHQPTP